MRIFVIVILALSLVSLPACSSSEVALKEEYQRGFDDGFSAGTSSESTEEIVDSEPFDQQDVEYPIDSLIASTGLKSLDIPSGTTQNESKNYVNYETTIQMQREMVGEKYLKSFYLFDNYDVLEIKNVPYIFVQDFDGTIYMITINEDVLAQLLSSYRKSNFICEIKITAVEPHIGSGIRIERADNAPDTISSDDLFEYVTPYIVGTFSRVVFGTCEIIHFT